MANPRQALGSRGPGSTRLPSSMTPTASVGVISSACRNGDLPAFFGPVITGEQRQLKSVVRLRVLPGQREPALPASALRHPSQH